MTEDELKATSPEAPDPVWPDLSDLLKRSLSLKEDGRLEELPPLLDQISGQLNQLAVGLEALAGLYDSAGEFRLAAQLTKAREALVPEDIHDWPEPEEFGFQAEEEIPEPAPVPTETLAELYYRQGFPEKALDIYKQLLDIDPTNTRIIEKADDLREEIAFSPGPAADTAPALEAPPEEKVDQAKVRLLAKLEKLAAATRRRQAAIHAA